MYCIQYIATVAMGHDLYDPSVIHIYCMWIFLATAPSVQAYSKYIYTSSTVGSNGSRTERGWPSGIFNLPAFLSCLSDVLCTRLAHKNKNRKKQHKLIYALCELIIKVKLCVPAVRSLIFFLSFPHCTCMCLLNHFNNCSTINQRMDCFQ